MIVYLPIETSTDMKFIHSSIGPIGPVESGRSRRKRTIPTKANDPNFDQKQTILVKASGLDIYDFLQNSGPDQYFMVLGPARISNFSTERT